MFAQIGGFVFGDKGYCVKSAQDTLKCKGCHNATIWKNNMKGKNKDKDHWLSKMHAPYERVFSKRPKRVRYRGTAKVQFQVGHRCHCSQRQAAYEAGRGPTSHSRCIGPGAETARNRLKQAKSKRKIQNYTPGEGEAGLLHPNIGQIKINRQGLNNKKDLCIIIGIPLSFEFWYTPLDLRGRY